MIFVIIKLNNIFHPLCKTGRWNPIFCPGIKLVFQCYTVLLNPVSIFNLFFTHQDFIISFEFSSSIPFSKLIINSLIYVFFYFKDGFSSAVIDKQNFLCKTSNFIPKIIFIFKLNVTGSSEMSILRRCWHLLCINSFFSFFILFLVSSIQIQRMLICYWMVTFKKEKKKKTKILFSKLLSCLSYAWRKHGQRWYTCL